MPQMFPTPSRMWGKSVVQDEATAICIPSLISCIYTGSSECLDGLYAWMVTAHSHVHTRHNWRQQMHSPGLLKGPSTKACASNSALFAAPAHREGHLCLYHPGVARLPFEQAGSALHHLGCQQVSSLALSGLLHSRPQLQAQAVRQGHRHSIPDLPVLAVHVAVELEVIWKPLRTRCRSGIPLSRSPALEASQSPSNYLKDSMQEDTAWLNHADMFTRLCKNDAMPRCCSASCHCTSY